MNDLPGEHAHLPHYVYEFIAADGSHLYVGCTVNLPQRLANHRASREWFGDVVRVEADLYPNQRAALAAEQERIELYQPAHNTIHTDRYEPGGWTRRRAAMAAAHAAGEQCRDKTCRDGCDDKAHAQGVTCSREPDCRVCEAYMPFEYVGYPQEIDCWRELSNRHGGILAKRMAYNCSTAFDALMGDELGWTLEDFEADHGRPLTLRLLPTPSMLALRPITGRRRSA